MLEMLRCVPKGFKDSRALKSTMTGSEMSSATISTFG